MTFTNSFNESVQKSNKVKSVLIIKDEKETPGINKNNNAQEIELLLLKLILLHKL